MIQLGRLIGKLPGKDRLTVAIEREKLLLDGPITPVKAWVEPRSGSK